MPLLALLALPALRLASVPGAEPVDYDAQIQPLFDATCSGAFCHIRLVTSGVELTSHATTVASIGSGYARAVVVPADFAASPLWEKIASDAPAVGTRMPLGDARLTEAEIDLVARWIEEGALPSPRDLLRGDVDSSQDLTITDPIFILNFLFLGGESPPCLPLANVNGDEDLDVSDPVFLLANLFLGGPPPPPLTAAERAACGSAA